jgi:hypothetical protein
MFNHKKSGTVICTNLEWEMPGIGNTTSVLATEVDKVRASLVSSPILLVNPVSFLVCAFTNIIVILVCCEPELGEVTIVYVGKSVSVNRGHHLWDWLLCGHAIK